MNLPAERDEVDSDYSDAHDFGQSASDQDSIVLPASAFATTPKDGDRITFCVTGSSEDGVQGYWMTDDKEEAEESWEDAAVKSIKPPKGEM